MNNHDVRRESQTQAMTQYEYPPQPFLSSSEGMERVMSSMSDEAKAGKMAVKESILIKDLRCWKWC